MEPGVTLQSAAYIAAKQPLPGYVKTRLAAVLGDDAAVRLYAAFLEDIAIEFGKCSTPMGWFVDPFGSAWRPPILGSHMLSIVLQPQGDWAQRQAWLFAHSARRGNQRTLVIASDSPQLTHTEVDAAMAALDSCQLVLGPVPDGGYYLLGMRGAIDILDGLEMSVPDVAERIIARARVRGLRVAVLPTRWDVDTIEDFAVLHADIRGHPHLSATREVLATLLTVPA